MNEYAVMPLNDYVNTCDMIRQKTKGTSAIKSGDLPEKVGDVFNAGVDKGWEDAYGQGYEEGTEAGKQSEYDKFWDTFQENGNRTNYYTGFGGPGWTNETFKPKYDIIAVESAYMLFINTQIKGDLVEILDNLGITLDLSQTTVPTYAFSATQFTRVGVVSAKGGTQISNIFQNSRQLETIDKLIIKDTGDQIFSNPFQNCSALKNITFEGAIGQNVSFQHSPLTVASMNNIIAHLKDYSSTGGTHTLTLKKDRETMLTAEEKAVATSKGWTLVWS